MVANRRCRILPAGELNLRPLYMSKQLLFQCMGHTALKRFYDIVTIMAVDWFSCKDCNNFIVCDSGLTLMFETKCLHITTTKCYSLAIIN